MERHESACEDRAAREASSEHALHADAHLAAHHREVHRAKSAHERGAAILLALVAVSLAMLIGLAVASSRDANTSASGGVALATRSRAASAGALDIAEYISQRHTVSLAGNPAEESRQVFAPKKLGSSVLTATMHDANTQMSPSEESVGLAIEASATTDGVVSPSGSVRRIDWADTADRADFDLSEFALLTTTGNVTIGGGSEVSVWRDAPLVQLGEPLVIGNRLRDPAKVDIKPDAIVLGHQVLIKGKFAKDASAADEQLANREFTIPADIVVPAAPRQGFPTTAVSIAPTKLPDMNIPVNGVVPHVKVSVSKPFTANNLVVKGPIPAGTWRVICFQGNVTLSKCNWQFEVPTMLVVNGNLSLTDTKLSAAPNGALAILPTGSVTLVRSVIGPDDGNGTTKTDAVGGATYGGVGASRVMLYAQKTKVTLSNASVLKGQIYAPLAAITLQAGSAIYGRALGASIDLSRSNLYYDPALNTGRGWLNPRSGLWWRLNELRREVASVSMLNDQVLSDFTKRTLVSVDTPETGMIATANVAAAGGLGTATANVATSSATATNADMVPGTTIAGAEAVYPDLYVVVNGTLRDFREASEPGGHPDFDNPSLLAGLRWGLVEPQLSADGKPVLKATKTGPVAVWYRDAAKNLIAPVLYDKSRGDVLGKTGRVTASSITSAESFASWFRDSAGVNLSEPFRLILRRYKDAAGRQTYVFDSNSADPFYNDGPGPRFDGFFPLEDRLLGNSALKTVRVGQTDVTRDRNYHFTLELEVQFTYDAKLGQTFTVQGTDDIWAFIDGKLVADLGGVHSSNWQMVPLDRLGLTDGGKSTLKIFIANRSRPNSHFRLATNFPLAAPLPPPPPPSPTSFLQQLATQRAAVRAAFMSRK